jgi:Protein of unknown function (DUF3224)
MSKISRAAAAVAGLCLSLGFGSFAGAQTQSPVAKTQSKETLVTKHAKGTFEVKLAPQTDDKVGDPTVGRMSLDKVFSGDLEAVGRGQMLGVRTEIEGSAGYVAMERVAGKLHGREGSFALQHSGTMTRGAMQLNITVVPDSGTGQLAGITGKMQINIADGKHSYEFEYTLPQPH